MTEMKYEALYYDVCRQNADLSAMVDKYQNEIIPQYDKLLEKARAERDAKTQEVVELKTELVKRSMELDTAMEQLKKFTGCDTCKNRWTGCNYIRCSDQHELWKWEGSQEAWK